MEAETLGKKRRKKRLITCRLRVADLSPEDRRRIVEAQGYEQQAVNRIWARWLQNSLAAKKDEDLRIFLGLYQRWKERGGEKPKLEMAAVDKPFAKRITAELRELLPAYNMRCLTLTVNRVLGCIRNNASHTGGLKLWQAVLLSRERASASDGPIAVPFDQQNAWLKEEDGHVWLGVRLDAFEVEGQVNRASHLTTMRLVLPEDDRKRLVRLVREAARGERGWSGSKLRYDTRSRKFMVCLVVDDEEPAEPVAGDVTASLEAPEERACWRLRVVAKRLDIGTGRSVAFLRQWLAREAELRRDNGFLSPARNGHGRKRRLKGWMRLTGKWENKTRTWNGQAVARIVKELVLAGAARLRVVLPGAKSVLQTAGGDSPAWPVYAFRTNLERKAAAHGISVEFSEGETGASNGAVGSSERSGCMRWAFGVCAQGEDG